MKGNIIFLTSKAGDVMKKTIIFCRPLNMDFCFEFHYNSFVVTRVPMVQCLIHIVFFQQAVISLSGSLTITLMVADLICADRNEELKSRLVGTAMFLSGVTTILQCIFGIR